MFNSSLANNNVPFQQSLQQPLVKTTTYSPFSPPKLLDNNINLQNIAQNSYDLNDDDDETSNEDDNNENENEDENHINNNQNIPIEEEEDLVDEATMQRIMIKKEARNREKLAREKSSSRQSIEEAREQEKENPNNLAEILRIMLFFVNEELVGDPNTDFEIKIPTLRGEFAENMVITIYQFYCG